MEVKWGRDQKTFAVDVEPEDKEFKNLSKNFNFLVDL